MKDKIIRSVSEYYTNRLQENGATPRGVDWNGHEGQFLRFSQLCRVINIDTHFSLNDLGCGYGALIEFLNQHYPDKYHYFGNDISKAMIEAARALHGSAQNLQFHENETIQQTSDFSVASGIFNVKMDFSEDEWIKYILKSLDHMNSMSQKGFSFNCLTKYSDTDKMKNNLYYADPLYLFDYCKRNFSRNVALLHDYELYEFTILVRKSI